ncbi:MAG: mRNA surveillance protein pelota [Candidatus Micrarchaeia archaeon]|jgi:protein pelota
MRVFFDRQEGALKASPQSVEDLWYLSRLVGKGDRVEGTSLRRVKAKGAGEEGTRADSGEKKPVRLELEVSNVEFAESANKLRITGKILSGTPAEFVQAGSFHTIDVEPRTQIVLKKDFTPFDFELISEAKKSARQVRAVIIAIDERHATASALRMSGIDVLFEAGNPASKRGDLKLFEEQKKGFYNEIAKQLESVQADFFVVAGPGFAPADFKKYLDEKFPAIAKKARLEHAGSSERSAATELLKRGVLESFLGEQKLQEEFGALEAFKASLGREDGLSCYGIDDVAEASQRGAVDKLLMLDLVLRTVPRAQKILENAKASGAKIVLFNSDDEAGAEFAAFKIAALLRYKKY